MSQTEALRMQQWMAEETMTSTATIQRPGEYVSGPGGSGTFGPNVTVAFTCRLATVGAGDEAEIAAEPSIVEVVRMVYPLVVDVRQDDEIVVDGRTYAVVAIRPRGTRAVQGVAVLRRVVA